jgi:DNA-binding CsgD family transcriptional regulator
VESVRKYENFGSDSINKGLIRAFKIENQIVITSGHELYTYDDLNDSIVPYIHLNELLGEYRKARRVVATSNHNYWFITDKGMAFFRIYADEVKKIKDYPIEIFENNLIPDHENIVQLNDSTAMVCMENGYTILNLNNKPAGNEIEAHHLTLRKGSAFNSNGDHIPMDVNSKIVSLEHSQNNLSLQYSFPILNGEAIKFQYQIEGLADKWSSKMDQPRIELSRIPAGEYTISIKAVNNWLQSSKINQIKLIVHPPWYITTWAMLIYGLLMIILILGFRHITSRKIKLKEKRKREEKEKELVQLKNEKLSSELSLKSQKLASSAMSIIKKNEFLLSLKAKINKQKEILGTRYPDKYYQDLIDKIDGNITGQDDWQLFEANFEQAHETFLRTMKNQFPDLTPSDLRLCAYLRINLTSKEIAPLLGISVRGVENHRYRLRKKLGLTGDDNLIDFIINAN